MNHLGVFAKYWEPGSVKTRLAASIGSENAASLYREFVRQTLNRLGQTGHSRSLWIWPPDKTVAFSQICSGDWTIEKQMGGDLGQRMLDYFQVTLGSKTTTENSNSVLIGSDSPDLDRDIIEQAFVALNKHQCVLGPSDDGGYYLIGMSEIAHNVFDNVQWSSPAVLQQTIEILDEAGLSWHQLPVRNDVDDLDDLKRLVQNLESRIAKPNSPSELDRQLLAAIQTFGIPANDDV